MIKIKLDGTFHTFIPYQKAQNEFREMGIEFVTEGSYDIAFVDYHKFSNKKVPLKQSIETGLEYIKQYETGPHILFDSQDSHSFIGTFDVFKHSKALALLKTNMLKDKELYKKPFVGGRYYWGADDNPINNYSIPEWDEYSDRIMLSGTNWLGVPDVQWFDYKNIEKLFDVSGMFQFPHPECHEHDLTPSQDYFYNKHRQPVIDILNRSPFMVAKLYKGRRYDSQKYFRYISQCKVFVAPFGYGEMAPRDIEAAQLGSILIKPCMDHIESEPFVYEKNVTYIPCKHDYSDLEEKIEYAVENFDKLRDNMVENMRNQYTEKYHKYYLPMATADILKKLNLVNY